MLFFLLFPFKGITIGGLANREECFLKIIARKLEYTVELDGGGGFRVYGLLSLLCNFHRVAGKWVVGILRNKGSKLRGRRPRLNSRRDGVKVWNIVVRDVKGMYSYAVFDEFREERAMNLSLCGWFIIIYCSILKAIRISFYNIRKILYKSFRRCNFLKYYIFLFFFLCILM